MIIILRFTYGETVFDGSKFCYELVDGRGLGSGIELYEKVNMEIGLLYTVGSYEINETFRFSGMDGEENRVTLERSPPSDAGRSPLLT
jgi:hypothetical protein